MNASSVQQIAPVAVATARVDVDVSEVSVNDLHGLGPVEIEDDVGIGHVEGIGEDDLVGLAEDSALLRSRSTGAMQSSGLGVQRTVLLRVVALGLNAAAARRALSGDNRCGVLRRVKKMSLS